MMTWKKLRIEPPQRSAPDASLIDNLIAVFRPNYEFFGKEPKLSRLTLREMMFYEFRATSQTVPRYAA